MISAGSLDRVTETSGARTSTVVAVGSAVSIGVMTAIQARINGVLGVTLDDGILAGLVSFGIGLLALVVLVPLMPRARASAARLWNGVRTRSIPIWMLLGGACGAFTVSTQGLVAGALGVALFTIGVVAGQTLHGLFLDRIGFGPAGVVAITPGRVLGGALVLVAVGISLSGDVLSQAPLWMLLMPFVAGVGIAWQSAANGRLAQRIQSPIVATFASFLGGAILLALAAAFNILVTGPPAPFPTEPWLYLGGLIGVAYILLGTFIVARIGVLLLGLGSVLGQLLTSAVIDLVWPTAAGPAAWQIVTMAAVGLAAVVVAIPWRRRR